MIKDNSITVLEKLNPITSYSAVREKLVKEKRMMKKSQVPSPQMMQRLFLRRYQNNYFTFCLHNLAFFYGFR